jgi:N-methylhydantoinase A
MGNGLPAAKLNKEFQKLEASARREFRAEQWRGALHYERSLDLRYRGQGYELNLPATANIAARFHAEHQKRYGYHHAGREIELVTVRLRTRLRTPPPKIYSRAARQTVASKAARVTSVERTPVLFHNKTIATPVFERMNLVSEKTMIGPAVITEYSATTVVPAGKKFWVDAAENLIIKIS